MRPWREAKFGLFLHWGAYSIYGGTYKGKEKQYNTLARVTELLVVIAIIAILMAVLMPGTSRKEQGSSIEVPAFPQVSTGTPGDYGLRIFLT